MDKHKIMVYYSILLMLMMSPVIVQSLFSEKGASSRRRDVCTSKECKQGAFILQNSIDMNAKPCDNFYKFACGRYSSVFPLGPNQSWRCWTNDLVEQISRRVQSFLTLPRSKEDPEVVNLLRGLYASCLNEDLIFKSNYNGISALLKVMGLPILPIYEKEAKVDWLRMMAIGIQSGTNQFLFDVAVYGEANNQQLNTVYVTKGSNNPILGYQWGFEVGNFELFKYPTEAVSLVSNIDIPTHHGARNADDGTNSDKDSADVNIGDGNDQKEDKTGEDDNRERKSEREEPEIKVDIRNKPAFTKFVLAAMKLLRDHFQISDVNFNDPQLLRDLDDLFDFLYRKDMIQNAAYLDKRQQKMTNLKTLQKKTNKIMQGSHVVDWTKLLNLIFREYLSPSYEFNEEDTIGVYSLEYIRKALSLLAKTDGRIIAMAMWFETLQTFALVSTRQLKEVYFAFRQEIGELPSPPQDVLCTRTIMSKYAMAISYMFTKEPGAFFKKYKVQVMADLILRIFKRTLMKADWINTNTKIAALDKTSRMKTYIGFEWWLKHHGQINDYYTDYPINNKGFMQTIVAYNAVAKKSNLSSLFSRNHPDRSGRSMAPSVVNACYNPNLNSLTLPYAALNLPYYNYGIEALNYGSMGLMIAHEVAHGFDDIGKDYDPIGDGNPWMSKDTTKKFRDGAKCFVKSYGQLHVDELNVDTFKTKPRREKQYNRRRPSENYIKYVRMYEIYLIDSDDTDFSSITPTLFFDQNRFVDGELTLNENIADNGGLAMAYEAYKLYRQNYEDKILPGFEMFSHEQLFTLGFAMTQCGHYSKDAYFRLIKDEHTPPEQRVNGLMMNFSEFSKIWGCPVNSPMNPSTKCKIW